MSTLFTVVLVALRKDPEHQYCLHMGDLEHPALKDGACASCHRYQIEPHFEFRWIQGQWFSQLDRFGDPVDMAFISTFELVEVRFGSDVFTPSQWKTFGSPFSLTPEDIALKKKAIAVVRNAIQRVHEDAVNGVSHEPLF